MSIVCVQAQQVLEVMEDSPLKPEAPSKARESTKETQQLKKQIQAAKEEIKELKDQGQSLPHAILT